MFGRFLEKKKHRVFLGTLAVAPRTDFKRKFDEKGLFEKNEHLDSNLRQNLVDIFTLPFASEITEPLDTDLGLDVIIPRFQSGDSWSLDLGDVGFPLFWRPKIEVKSRLYNLKTNKTKISFSVTEKLTWGKFFGRVFTVRAFVRYRPMFDKYDMEYLLYKACEKLLIKMKNKI